MVVRTLRAMADGGMRDHVGGGFHRYSVDADWRVPHFEKMLYDQAQLSLAYLEAHQATGDSGSRRGRRRHAALRLARDDRPGRRVLLGRGRRQPAARGRRRHRARASPRAPSTCGRPTRSTPLLGDDAALVRARFGIEARRQRAVRPARRVHREEPPLRRGARRAGRVGQRARGRVTPRPASRGHGRRCTTRAPAARAPCATTRSSRRGTA